MEKFNGDTTKYTKVEHQTHSDASVHAPCVCPVTQIQYLPSTTADCSELCTVLQFIECTRVSIVNETAMFGWKCCYVKS